MERPFEQVILDSMNFSVLVCNKSGSIIYQNAPARELTSFIEPDAAFIQQLFPELNVQPIQLPLIVYRGLKVYQLNRLNTFSFLDASYNLFSVKDITEAEHKELLYTAFSDQFPLGLFQLSVNKNLDVLYGNEAFFRINGIKRNKPKDTFKAVDFIYSEDYEYVFDMLTHAREKNQKSLHLELRIQRKDGSICWISLHGIFLYIDKLILCGYIIDITARKKAENRVRIELLYRASLTADSLLSFEFNLNQDKVTQEFPGLYTRKLLPSGSMVDYSYSSILQLWSQRYIYPEDQQAFLDFFSICSLRKKFQEGLTELSLDYRCWNYKHQLIWVKGSTCLIQLWEHGSICGFVYVKDIDAQKKRELKLQHRAQVDSLTKIYNRATGQEKIEYYLKRNPDTLNAFMILDLDDFKHINDTFGHQVGDIVLQRVGENLSNLFRKTDVVCRLGGDEFCILIKNIHSPHILTFSKAPLVCQALSIPYPNETSTLHTTGSVGIVIFRCHDTSFATIYHKADQALYRAKTLGKNQFYITEL